MTAPKPSPDLFPKKTVEAKKPKRDRVRRHLTQKVHESLNGKPDAEVLRTYHKKEK